jgi:hypothetical protein
VRAALEELVGTAPHLLAGLVDEERCRRDGRPVCLGKNLTRPDNVAARPTIIPVREDRHERRVHHRWCHPNGAPYSAAIDGEDETIAELEMIVGFDDDLVGEATCMTNGCTAP